MAKKETGEKDILFIGECGSGKSTTINSLLGTKECKAGKTFCVKGITRHLKQYSGTLSFDHYSSKDKDSREQRRPDFKNTLNDEESKTESKTGIEDDQIVDKNETEAEEKINQFSPKMKSEGIEEIESTKNRLAKEETEQRQNEDEGKEKINQFTFEGKSEEMVRMEFKKDRLAIEETKQEKNEDKVKFNPETKSEESERINSKIDHLAKEETKQRSEDEAEKRINQVTPEMKSKEMEGMESRNDHLSKDETGQGKNMDDAKEIKINQFTPETKSEESKRMELHLANEETELRQIKDEEEGKINQFTPEEKSEEMEESERMESKRYSDSKEIEKISVNLYDTPVFEELVEDFEDHEGFHAIVLIFPLTRYTQERKKFLKQVRDAFNQTINDHIIIIFTKNEDQGGLEEIKRQVKEVDDKVLSTIIEKSGERCILFGSPTENVDEKQKMIQEFSEKLKDVLDRTKERITLKGKKPPSCFSSFHWPQR